ncbi:HRDC domain-containing protein [Dyadobacter jiangsuensis]|uniref:HRDC domain-containing protein n=1 Tax=Dyadobacter jiangsuensis TaxID=1591085 RepID=A0A2P8GB31_9BACT|nr:HRDC domain-containing protein [Dyadobacter jiangsuensis]PSL31186.1 HRDC domain-containing protein [Dyadobacter jiangsuensis]
MHLDLHHQTILNYLTQTDKPIFLTGRAGTGKTTFLQHIRQHLPKEMVVVAPTAVAAINAGGVTIHSFFQVPLGPLMPGIRGKFRPQPAIRSVSPEKEKMLRRMQLLIIDEISMVRADTLDYLDALLRLVRASARPFGGVQLLMIGDPYQLPPVTNNDWDILSSFYKSPYFFDALIWGYSGFLTFELAHVYRQSDPVFIDILNSVRDGRVTENTLSALNKRYITQPDFDLSDYVTLSTHNNKVKEINQQRLNDLPTPEYVFSASISVDFPSEAYPAERELVLKEGAYVMFIKNDSSGKKQYYNGRAARVASIESGRVHVRFLDDGSDFIVSPEIWQNVKYALSETEGKISESTAGTFTQLPLRLSWAVTIHKSQGLTFDKLVVDVRTAFAPGQVYVALSRCRSLEGLVLLQPVNAANVMVASAVKAFMQNASINACDDAGLDALRHDSVREAVLDLFDFTILAECWEHVLGFISQHDPLNGSLGQGAGAISRLIHTDLVKVAVNFRRQELLTLLDSPAERRSEDLPERLTKAISYFFSKLNEAVREAGNLLSQWDQRAPDPDFHLPAARLRYCLALKAGIFLKLSEAKSLAELAPAAGRALSQHQTDKGESKSDTGRKKQPVNAALFDKLIEWRANIAEQRNTQPYTIVSDNVLTQVAVKMPHTLTQLSQIKNFGQARASDFGRDIIGIILANSGATQLF